MSSEGSVWHLQPEKGPLSPDHPILRLPLAKLISKCPLMDARRSKSFYRLNAYHVKEWLCCSAGQRTPIRIPHSLCKTRRSIIFPFRSIHLGILPNSNWINVRFISYPSPLEVTNALMTLARRRRPNNHALAHCSLNNYTLFWPY